MIVDEGDPQPDVSVVVATRGRPELLRRAVESILQQSYTGTVEVIVVFDQTDVDPLTDVVVPVRRSLHTVPNARTPGLAGGRNTGIEAGTRELLAFCDDDDEWLPDKITDQVAMLRRNPGAALIATGIQIQTEGSTHVRLPPEMVEFKDLLRSRLTEIHPSSFLMRRSDVISTIGLVDEALPFSYGEDYDFLLRAAKMGVVVSVRRPLVTVNWNRSSFFAGRWQGIAEGLTYLLHKHPEFSTSPVGSARIEGQIAFAHAALGQRHAALGWASRAIRHDPRQLRAYAAVVVAIKLLPADFAVRAVNSRGHGL